jgi:ribosomal protein S18 acetylase RimI-like enzyme
MPLSAHRITNPQHPDLATLLALYESAFPPEERIELPTDTLRHFVKSNSAMHFFAVYTDTELAGFYIYWLLPHGCYLHFLATFPHLRGQKIGSWVLETLSTSVEGPLFVEAEFPVNELAERRLNFYKRHGFDVIAENPTVLWEARKRSCELLLLANQPVADWENAAEEICEAAY